MKVALEIDGKRYAATFQVAEGLTAETTAKRIAEVLENTVLSHLGVAHVTLNEES